MDPDDPRERRSIIGGLLAYRKFKTRQSSYPGSGTFLWPSPLLVDHSGGLRLHPHIKFVRIKDCWSEDLSFWPTVIRTMETTVSPISIRSTCKCGCDHPNRCSVPAVLCLSNNDDGGYNKWHTETTVSPQNSQPPPTRHGAGVLKVARAMGQSTSKGLWGYPKRNDQHVYIFLASRLEKDTTMGIYHQDCILTGSWRLGIFLWMGWRQPRALLRVIFE